MDLNIYLKHNYIIVITIQSHHRQTCTTPKYTHINKLQFNLAQPIFNIEKRIFNKISQQYTLYNLKKITFDKHI